MGLIYPLEVPKIDWSIVKTAALSGLVLLVPLALLNQWLIDEESTNFAKLGFFGAFMFAFAAAGYGGGKLAPHAPMAHGALGAAGSYAVIQAFGIIRRLIAGGDLNFAGYPLLMLLAAGCGIFGAAFADWVQRSGRPTSVEELRNRLP